ncbi:hypothetical protein STEG23_033248 [Scotinomys teguina]
MTSAFREELSPSPVYVFRRNAHLYFLPLLGLSNKIKLLLFSTFRKMTESLSESDSNCIKKEHFKFKGQLCNIFKSLYDSVIVVTSSYSASRLPSYVTWTIPSIASYHIKQGPEFDHQHQCLTTYNSLYLQFQ